MVREFIDNVPIAIQNITYHSPIFKLSFGSGDKSNVCFKSLAVLEGREDGKVTQLIILQ